MEESAVPSGIAALSWSEAVWADYYWLTHSSGRCSATARRV